MKHRSNNKHSLHLQNTSFFNLTLAIKKGGASLPGHPSVRDAECITCPWWGVRGRGEAGRKGKSGRPLAGTPSRLLFSSKQPASYSCHYLSKFSPSFFPSFLPSFPSTSLLFPKPASHSSHPSSSFILPFLLSYILPCHFLPTSLVLWSSSWPAYKASSHVVRVDVLSCQLLCGLSAGWWWSHPSLTFSMGLRSDCGGNKRSLTYSMGGQTLVVIMAQSYLLHGAEV